MDEFESYEPESDRDEWEAEQVFQDQEGEEDAEADYSDEVGGEDAYLDSYWESIYETGE